MILIICVSIVIGSGALGGLAGLAFGWLAFATGHLLAQNFGTPAVYTTTAVVPSGKGALTVNGPIWMRWQLYNETASDAWRYMGARIEKGAGYYGIRFSAVGRKVPAQISVILRKNQGTVVTVH